MMRKPICLSFNLEEINLEVGGWGITQRHLINEYR